MLTIDLLNFFVVRAQKGRRPLILSDTENATALAMIQQVDDSVPSVQPERNLIDTINGFTPSL